MGMGGDVCVHGWHGFHSYTFSLVHVFTHTRFHSSNTGHVCHILEDLPSALDQYKAAAAAAGGVKHPGEPVGASMTATLCAALVQLQQGVWGGVGMVWGGGEWGVGGCYIYIYTCTSNTKRRECC